MLLVQRDFCISGLTYRGVGMNSAAFKLLVGKTDRRNFGAHILSANATVMINTFTLAMHNRIPVKELHRESVMPPTRRGRAISSK